MVQSGELCAASVAVDSDGAGSPRAVFAEWRAYPKRGFCGQSTTRLRDGAAGLSAASAARTDGRGISRGVHVHDRDATQLGNLVPGK